MSAGELEFEALKVDNAQRLEIAAEREKLKRKEAIKPPQTKGVKQAVSKELNATQIKHLAQVEKEAKEKEEARITSALYKKWCLYVVRFPEECRQVGKAITEHSNSDTIQKALDALRSRIAAQSAHAGAKLFIEGLAGLIEYITIDQGFNPLQLNVKDLRKSVRNELNSGDENMFEPEASECAVELADFLTGPWYYRLGRKLAEAAKVQHDYNKRKVQEVGGMPFENLDPNLNTPEFEIPLNRNK